MNRRMAAVLIIAMVLLMGYIVYGSMARVEYTCDLCVEFNGMRECRRGAGATEEEAAQAAQTSACGTMAQGMDQSIRCQNQRPAIRQCQRS